MKKNLLFLIFLLLNCFNGYSQEIINNPAIDTHYVIQQISTLGINDILSFQDLNKGICNFASTLQNGNQNKAIVNQQNYERSEMSNQSYTTQLGNANELTIGQIGKGNLFLGFQLGYLATQIESQQESPFGVENNQLITFLSPEVGNGSAVEGERNKMSISQFGNNNGVLAVQQGFDNNLSAEQTGKNNYLLALQIGTHNSVTGYKQANESDQILFDKIIQVGDNLSLNAEGASTYQPVANTFTQIGSNLALEVNSDLLNTLGGGGIKQTGNDMKVVVTQSYFSFQ